jgi:hypothetical protein
MKYKIKEFATNRKRKNIRDHYKVTNELERVYQPRNNLVKDENSDLLTDIHNSLKRRRNYFSQLLNVHSVIDVRQIQIHTAEPLVRGPSCLEV